MSPPASDVDSPTVCAVIGLGKIGSSLAAVLGAAGMPVVGVDLDERIVAAINRGVAPFPEPGLQHAIDRAGHRLRATTDTADAIRAADISFVVVPTPSDAHGGFISDAVVAAITSVGRVLATTDRYHVVSVMSTVMPRSMDEEIARELASSSGKRPGVDVGLCYNPIFIALGTVIHDLTHPDLVLIGESDACSGVLVEQVHQRICRNRPAMHHTNWVNAEIAKFGLNTFVTLKISFANMLGELCEHTPGSDVDAITDIVGTDHRVGHASLRAATAYGGPCFPRDNIAFVRAATEAGVEATLAEASDRVNHRQVDRLVATVMRESPPGATIAILGLAYKAETDVLDESQGLALAMHLIAGGHRVLGFDPLVGADRPTGVAGLDLVDRIEDCVRRADVVVLTTSSAEFRALPALIAERGRELVVIDCWRLFPEEVPGIRIVHPGRWPVLREERDGT